MNTVAVHPDVLRWAIARSGLPKEELAEKFPKLDAWIAVEKQPTFRQLENFAKATMTPLGALFLAKPPVEKLPVPDYRTKAGKPVDRPSPNLLDTIRIMQSRQAWMREWIQEQGLPELSFAGSVKPGGSIKSLAQEIRQSLELGAEWSEQLATWEDALTVLRRAIERAGILVFSNAVVGLNNHRPLDPDEFRGFVLYDKHAPLLFLNDADSKSARMFTLAHELVHVWIGLDGVFNLENMMPATDATEKYCNAVAAEFLVPEYKLRQIWDDVAHDTDRFKMIARRFKVSPIVAARRALDLQLITAPAFFRFYHANQAEFLARKAKERETPGGDFYKTQGARLGRPFSAAIVRAVREGRLLYRDAYHLTNMKGETFEKYAERVLQQMRDERE